MSKLTKTPIIIILIANIFAFVFLFAGAINSASASGATASYDTEETVWEIPQPRITIPGMAELTQPSACIDETDKKCVTWIGQYIQGIYNYSVGIVGIVAVVAMMFGGFLWITAGGSSTVIGEAKSWIGASLTGLLLVLFSYFIFYQINPNLVNLQPIKIKEVVKIETETTTEICTWNKAHDCTGLGTQYFIDEADTKCGTTKTPCGSVDACSCCCSKGKEISCNSGKCKSVDTGSCAVSNLSIFGEYATQASAICNVETSNGLEKCNPKTECPPYKADGTPGSVGIFQIKLSAHCSAANGFADAFKKDSKGNNTEYINNMTTYKNCRDKYLKDADNIQYAYKLFQSSGNSWKLWGSYNNKKYPEAAKCAGCF